MRRLILFLFLTFSYLSFASHLVGGEFFMLHLGKGNLYQLNLVTYIDDVNGDPGVEDDFFTAGIYEKGTNIPVETVVLGRQRPSTFLEYDNPICASIFPGIVTKVVRYEGEIALEPEVYNHPEGYYVVWERCCRNGIIENITVPEFEGIVFYMEFPPRVKNGLLQLNSTPLFNAPPAEFICVDRDYFYDFSATDDDGDSLVYSMVAPWGGHIDADDFFGCSVPGCQGIFPAPYDEVNWLPGFDFDQAIIGNPSLSIDAQTGLLHVNPNQAGLFVFAVQVEEYRNGEKIGLTRRDFQIAVIEDCPINRQPELLIPNTDGTYYSATDTIFITADMSGEERCLSILVVDSSDVLSVSANTVLDLDFDPQITITSDNEVNGLDTLEGQVCFEDCANSEGELVAIDLNALDNGCPFRERAQERFFFFVEPIANQVPSVSTNLASDTVRLIINNDTSFQVFGQDLDNDFIRLYAESNGFDRSSAGMLFRDVNGEGEIESSFRWEPTCEHLEFESGTIDFIVEDTRCQRITSDTTSVFFELKPLERESLDFVPITVITPNDDQVNDCFKLPSLPESICEDFFKHIIVYNRWGSEVYRSNDINFEWCDVKERDGVYFYSVEYDRTVFKSWLQIIR